MELVLRSSCIPSAPQDTLTLSLWKRVTEFIFRPHHCSTACVLRRLDPRQSHAEGLPYREHFLVRILELHREGPWDMYHGTAYVRVSPWLFQQYDRCTTFTIRYRTSRHRTPSELLWGKGVKAKIAV